MVIPYEIPIINMLCVEQGNYTSDCIELKRNAFIIKKGMPNKGMEIIQRNSIHQGI